MLRAQETEHLFTVNDLPPTISYYNMLLPQLRLLGSFNIAFRFGAGVELRAVASQVSSLQTTEHCIYLNSVLINRTSQ